MQNDPVNFVDPSGLVDDVIRTYTWARHDFPWDFFFRSFFSGATRPPLEREPREPRERPETPQNPGQTTPPPTDCQRFADIVDEIADAVFVNNNNSSTNSFPHNVNYFMDTLAQRFTGMRSATIWSAALQGGAGHTPVAGFNGNEFGSSGFRSQFYERPPGNNQVRHATGGLIAGYSGIGLERMNARENPDDPRGRNDINLNNQTVPMGGRLAGGGNGSTQLLARGLGQWIRDTLCGP